MKTRPQPAGRRGGGNAPRHYADVVLHFFTKTRWERTIQIVRRRAA